MARGTVRPRLHLLARTLIAAASVAGALLAPVASRVNADTAPVHVVQAGETLSDIADSVGVDSATLARLNAFDDANMLAIGQTVQLPVKSAALAPNPAASRTYTVADGDTLWDVAQRLGTTTAALVDANKLDDANHLALGTQLVIPAGATGASSAPSSSAATSAPAPQPPSAAAPRRTSLVSYTVQPGETLNQIARQFDVRPDAVIQASGLDDPNRISVGTVLKVPLPGHEHVVKPGETLRDIAGQEKADLGSLVDFNQLDDPELIRVGQVVLIPATAAANQQAASSNAPVQRSAQAAPQDAAASSAKTATPTPAPSATAAPNATQAPSATAAPKPAASASPPPQPAPKPSATPAPAAPVAVVAPPAGSPTDGLAGASLKLLGLPYVWGGSAPSGFDCSGFVWYVARQVGKPLSRGLFGEYNSGSHPSRDELKTGDLVFFQNTYSAGLSHNGIYIGNGQFVHAADENAGVTVSSLGTAYWSGHWFGATRLP